MVVPDIADFPYPEKDLFRRIRLMTVFPSARDELNDTAREQKTSQSIAAVNLNPRCLQLLLDLVALQHIEASHTLRGRHPQFSLSW